MAVTLLDLFKIKRPSLTVVVPANVFAVLPPSITLPRPSFVMLVSTTPPPPTPSTIAELIVKSAEVPLSFTASATVINRVTAAAPSGARNAMEPPLMTAPPALPLGAP